MRIFRIFRVKHDLHDKEKHAELFALGRVRRLFHVKVRRHTIGLAAGGGLMLIGSTLAIYGKGIPAPHILIDGLAYFIHGIGAIPFIRHIEPIFDALSDHPDKENE